MIAAHGVPPDLLARLLIIPTRAYDPGEIKTIIQLRARTEGLNLADAALDKVAQHGVNVSLRYALQLLTPAHILARVNGRQEIGVDEVNECEELFLDARRSAGMINTEEYIIA